MYDQVKYLEQLSDKEPVKRKFYKQLSAELMNEYPKHLPLLMEKLKRTEAALKVYCSRSACVLSWINPYP